MNYPRSKFSKHSDYFLISYGHCSNCSTCAIRCKWKKLNISCNSMCHKPRSCHNTLPGQKYWNTTKYACTDCAIYRLNIQFGAKMGIEIYRYQKFVVLASTWVEFFYFFDIPYNELAHYIINKLTPHGMSKK